MNHLIDEKKRVAAEYLHRLWNEKDLSVIDDLLHSKCVIHTSFGEFQGSEYCKKMAQIWLSGFPDLTVEINSIIAEGDMVVIHWHAYGPHQGEFKGIKATGRMITYDGASIYHICEGKIMKYWSYFDMQHLINQVN